MLSIRSRAVRLALAGAISGMSLFAATPAQAADASVSIVEGAPDDANTWGFDPAEVTIKVGQTVMWTNNGAQPHTASAADSSFDSGALSNGQTFEHKFDTAGSYDYVCAFHSQMLGKVIVT